MLILATFFLQHMMLVLIWGKIKRKIVTYSNLQHKSSPQSNFCFNLIYREIRQGKIVSENDAK